MKKIVLITAFFSQILFAQQNDLTIVTKPVTESNVNYETTLTVNAISGMENGFLIEIPAGMKMVPMNVIINQNELFLQNLNEIPSKETIVCWTLVPEGITLFFRDGQFSSGDQIVIKTMTTQLKKRFDENPTINIRTVQKNDSSIQYSEDIKSSANLLLKMKDER